MINTLKGRRVYIPRSENSLQPLYLRARLREKSRETRGCRSFANSNEMSKYDKVKCTNKCVLPSLSADEDPLERLLVKQVLKSSFDIHVALSESV